MQSNFWAGSKNLDQHKTFWDLQKDKGLEHTSYAVIINAIHTIFCISLPRKYSEKQTIIVTRNLLISTFIMENLDSNCGDYFIFAFIICFSTKKFCRFSESSKVIKSLLIPFIWCDFLQCSAKFSAL